MTDDLTIRLCREEAEFLLSAADQVQRNERWHFDRALALNDGSLEGVLRRWRRGLDRQGRTIGRLRDQLAGAETEEEAGT